MALIMMFFGDIIESKGVTSRSNSDSDSCPDSSKNIPFAMKDVCDALDSCIRVPKIAPFGMNEIVPGVFLGSQVASQLSDMLIDNGVGYIVNAAKGLPNVFPEKFKYLNLNLNDSPGQKLTIEMFDEVFDFIKEAHSKDLNVLIHCQAGISRSATFMIGYVMRTMKLKHTEAYDFVWQRRECIDPNIGFMVFLMEYEKHLASSSS
ncbi:MAG: dual specificity protein phosphatase 19-like [Terrestrivirus sp.]|uniref:Dual specificity protein phosphatase 19-like n=1 Tax=Terrestrivirus sp. TaxID=2487775 RepID=A0A3G4ZMB5_9VIRU|nr:MAG: dual specificity protein phosphatase 19-like [Terrestrivirus sp.]